MLHGRFSKIYYFEKIEIREILHLLSLNPKEYFEENGWDGLEESDSFWSMTLNEIILENTCISKIHTDEL